ncbi:MAG: hypothetical protein LBV75_04770, partial [Paludibacter sp.]|nr:hypothetical protein [Paludibacter sp.]
PTESDIEKPKEHPILAIGDGNNYTIEVLTKKRKRRISYSNFEEQYKNCIELNLNCPEYEKFTEFIQLIKTEIDF